MKELLTPILTLLLFLISFKGNSQSIGQNLKRTTKIAIEFSHETSLAVQYNDTHGINRLVTFQNPSKKDSTISIRLVLEKPTQFTYRSRLTPKFISLLVFPGDSIIISSNERIRYSTGYPKFMDDMLTIPSSIYESGVDEYGIFNTRNIPKVIQVLDSIFKLNQKTIKTNNTLNIQQRSYLNDLNMMVKHRLISKINYRGLPESDLKKMDSLYKEITENIDNLLNINLFNYAVVSRLKYYNALRNGFDEAELKTNPSSSLDKIDANIKNSKAYRKERYMYVENLFVDNGENFGYDRLENIDFSGLKRNKTKDAVSDSILKLISILLATKTDFKKAKTDLASFDNGSHNYLFDEENHPNRESRSISNLANVYMYTTQNIKTTLKKELAKDNSKIFVLDFWASWCGPCVADYPYLKNIEEEMKMHPIKFISISTDKKEDAKKWLSKLADLGGLKNPNSFLLEDFMSSPITSFFGIHLIPRYIVIDQKGNVLEEKFYGPQQPLFKSTLVKYLTLYK